MIRAQISRRRAPTELCESGGAKPAALSALNLLLRQNHSLRHGGAGGCGFNYSVFRKGVTSISLE